MRRAATAADAERWHEVIAKVEEASRALRDADTALGQTIIQLDGDDGTAQSVSSVLGAFIERARMVVGNIKHPVEVHWAGGPKDNPASSYHWRY